MSQTTNEAVRRCYTALREPLCWCADQMQLAFLRAGLLPYSEDREHLIRHIDGVLGVLRQLKESVERQEVNEDVQNEPIELGSIPGWVRPEAPRAEQSGAPQGLPDGDELPPR